METKNIMIVGVGGQGSLLASKLLGHLLLTQGYDVKVSEVHGMSQRGGAVEAHLRLSSGQIYSDLIAPGTADLIISVEPMEALRHLDSLSPTGIIVSNAKPIININDYPEVEKIIAAIEAIKGSKVIDADKIAADLGNPRSMNIVLLGAAAPFLGFDPSLLEATIASLFERKGQAVVDANLKAFHAII